ncbi:hypothetical protein RUM43_005718 [Polyplax serrata]|uniref:Uncharacterized protein n=1 Tax=Polyplax serrata TaxID=468196 RepID=A0AAN8S319_POLSC
MVLASSYELSVRYTQYKSEVHIQAVVNPQTPAQVRKPTTTTTTTGIIGQQQQANGYSWGYLVLPLSRAIVFPTPKKKETNSIQFINIRARVPSEIVANYSNKQSE